MAEKSMMIIASEWDGKPTFKMISISKEAPYNECIYDPERKALAIITKESKDKPVMMPKLDNHGRGKLVKGKNAEGQLVEQQAQERIIFPAFYEYFIEDETDIRELVNMFASNPKHKALGVMAPVGKAPAKKKTPTKTK
jgi:hypothetical protein